MKITAYQAAMLSMGKNVDDLEISALGDWVEDGDHLFRNIIIKDFVGNLFVLEHIVDEDGNKVRPWDSEVDLFPVKAVINENGVQYVELEDEEPLK